MYFGKEMSCFASESFHLKWYRENERSESKTHIPTMFFK